MLAIPGEVRDVHRKMMFTATQTEHGWPFVWMYQQTATPTTVVKLPIDDVNELFKDWLREKPRLKMAETEVDFSPQFFPPMATRFWSLSKTWPWASSPATLTSIRWQGLLLNLAILLPGIAVTYGCLRWLPRRSKRGLQISIGNTLSLIFILAIVGACFARPDRERDREWKAIKSLQSEPFVHLDFTNKTPIWLDRATDYRVRRSWCRNACRRGIPTVNTDSMGLYDRVRGIRIKTPFELKIQGIETKQRISEPRKAANALNQMKHLDQIWVLTKQSVKPTDPQATRHPKATISELLGLVEGSNITFLCCDAVFRFDFGQTDISHFKNLDALYIENCGDLKAGFVSAFPKMERLTIRFESIEDAAIEEIFSLKHLVSLSIGRFGSTTMTREQKQKFVDKARQRNIKLYIR